jgi:cyclic pyranopterin phosphate synthase
MSETNSQNTSKDLLGRALRDLRVSVTDRCNFRCVYCMPKEIFGSDYQFLPQYEVLTFEEIARLARIFVSLGTRKIRLTGGEPMVRRDVLTLIEMLAEIPDLEDLAMTTNGSFPVDYIPKLQQAGLQRMTVSLDSLDDDIFQSLNDVKFPVERVLNWIDAGIETGFSPIEVNMVVKRGVSDDSILPMARRFDTPDTILRFIEYMDVGNSNGWRMDDVVPAHEILKRLNAEMPLEKIPPNYPGEVARRFRYQASENEIGFIASVTQPFCGGCTRARLSANGSLYTCLFSANGHNLKSILRSGASDQELKDKITDIWLARNDQYSQDRSENTHDLPKVEMSFIGG